MTELIHFSEKAISAAQPPLMSKAVTDGSGRHKYPLHQPPPDLCKTVPELAQRGVEFLPIPEAYCADVPGRIGDIDEDVADLRRLGILVDRDDEGYLLQIFTKAVGDRPTVFFELIERHGARGFGEGNFKALFEALEREQDRRGNL